MGRSDEPLVTMNKTLFPEYKVYDSIELGGWEFIAEMIVSKKLGLASALQGGRIVSFTLTQNGECICAYEKGNWIIRLDEENDIGHIAMTYFLTKHNRRRSKQREKELKIL